MFHIIYFCRTFMDIPLAPKESKKKKIDTVDDGEKLDQPQEKKYII